MMERIDELKKKLPERAELLMWFITAWLLADEFVKENYFFNPADLFKNYLTHEQLIAIFAIAAGILRVYNYGRNKN